MDYRHPPWARPEQDDGRSGQLARTVIPRALRPASRFPCPATGCPATVPPRFFACRRHWNALPHALRMAIWNAYKPGQTAQTQTDAYRAAAAAAAWWLRAQALEEDHAE